MSRDRNIDDDDSVILFLPCIRDARNHVCLQYNETAVVCGAGPGERWARGLPQAGGLLRVQIAAIWGGTQIFYLIFETLKSQIEFGVQLSQNRNIVSGEFFLGRRFNRDSWAVSTTSACALFKGLARASAGSGLEGATGLTLVLHDVSVRLKDSMFSLL